MDSATPATTISKPWASLTDPASYYNLDSVMATKDFGMDWKNHPTCPSLTNWNTVVNLTTLSPPVLEKAYFDTGALNLWVSAPLTNGRAETVVALNDPNLNVTNPECIYPKSVFIDKQVSVCKDVWHFAIPWSRAILCNWKNVTTEEGYKVYRGQVVLRITEYLSDIQDWRQIQSVLRIKLRFQQFVQVTTPQDPTVYNTLNLKAAITKQIVAIDLGSPALVELVTLFNYPYKLTKGDLTLTPPGKVQSYVYTPVDCNTTSGVPCRQRWQATLSLTPTTCTLDGNYRMDWTVACGDTSVAANCALQPQDLPANVQFTLTSENFCAEVGVEVGLIGSLASFDDAALTNPKTAFIVGRTAYFLVKVNSELNTKGGDYDSDPNPQVKFAGNLKLQTVTVRQKDTTNIFRIFQNGNKVSSSDDYGTNCIEIPKTASTVAFSFVFASNLTSNLAQNSKLSFTIGAEVKVTYASKKRGLLQSVPADGEKKTYSVDNDVSPDTSSASSPASGTESSNSVVVVVSFLLSLLALLI